MTIRTWLQGTLVDDLDLAQIHQGRVFQGGSLRTADIPTPYIVHHIGNDSSEDLAENATPHRIFLMIYMHDAKGDFDRIDAMCALTKRALVGRSSPLERIITTRYLETSQDFNDAVLDTIFRYCRYQLIVS